MTSLIWMAAGIKPHDVCLLHRWSEIYSESHHSHIQSCSFCCLIIIMHSQLPAAGAYTDQQYRTTSPSDEIIFLFLALTIETIWESGWPQVHNIHMKSSSNSRKRLIIERMRHKAEGFELCTDYNGWHIWGWTCTYSFQLNLTWMFTLKQ